MLAFADSLRDVTPGRLMLSVSPDPPAPPLSPPFDAAVRATLATLLAMVDPQFSQVPPSDILEHALMRYATQSTLTIEWIAGAVGC